MRGRFCVMLCDGSVHSKIEDTEHGRAVGTGGEKIERGGYLLGSVCNSVYLIEGASA